MIKKVLIMIYEYNYCLVYIIWFLMPKNMNFLIVII